MKQGSSSVVVLILVILLLGVGYFGTYGQWTGLGENREALETAKTVNQQLQESKSEVTSFVNQVNSLQSNVDLADRALPKGDPDIPTLYDYYSRMVAESGMNLDVLNIIDRRNADITPAVNSIQPLDIDITVAGTYEAFNNYLLRLQRSLRIVDVLSVRITSDSTIEGSSGAQPLKFVLNLRTYYQQ